MFAPDILIKELLIESLTAVRADPALIDDVFSQLPTVARNRIKAYCSTMHIGGEGGEDDESPNLDVILGWSERNASMPSIAVIQYSEEETAQFVGADPGPMFDDETGDELLNGEIVDDEYHLYQVSQFSGLIDSAVYASNAEVTTWLCALVQWTLLRYRKHLTNLGLFEQRLTVTDFMPAPDYPQPDRAYTRVVKLSYNDLKQYRDLDHTGSPWTDTADDSRIEIEGL